MHVVIHADCLILVDIVSFWRNKQIRRKRCITPQGFHALEDVARIEMEGLAINDDLGTREFGSSGEFLVNNLIQLH